MMIRTPHIASVFFLSRWRHRLQGRLEDECADRRAAGSIPLDRV